MKDEFEQKYFSKSIMNTLLDLDHVCTVHGLNYDTFQMYSSMVNQTYDHYLSKIHPNAKQDVIDKFCMGLREQVIQCMNNYIEKQITQKRYINELV